MKGIISILLFFINLLMGQQNLVPNWSFELVSPCPTTGFQNLSFASPWFQPNYCVSNPSGSTDLYNSCISNIAYKVPNNGYNYQSAKSGFGYAAFTPFTNVLSDSNNLREYCQVRLLDTMKNLKNYCVKFFVSNVNVYNCSYVIDKIGCHLSQDTLKTNDQNWGAIPVSPQIENISPPITDSAGWTEISGIYSAIGNELFITIGNFRSYHQTNVDSMCPLFSGTVFPAYYFLDDVSVYEIPEVYAGKDTTFCPWQSAVLGPQTVRSDVQYRWSPAYGLNDSTLANPIATPLQTTTYTLTVIDTNQWACYSQMYDTVTVIVSGCVGVSENSPSHFGVKVYPNPFSESVNVEFNREGNYELKIFDISGKLVDYKKFSGKSFSYERKNLEEGIYYYGVKNDLGNIQYGKLVIE